MQKSFLVCPLNCREISVLAPFLKRFARLAWILINYYYLRFALAWILS